MHELGQEGPDGITEEHSLIANRFPEIGRTEQSHPRSYHRGHRCNRVLALSTYSNLILILVPLII